MHGRNHAAARAGQAAWLDVLAALALAVLSLGTLLFFLREPLLSDDSTYFDVAWSLLTDEARFGRSANLHRLGFLFTIAGSQLVFGRTPAAYHAVSLVHGIGLVIALYFLTRSFFPRLPSIIAALLLLTSPIFLLDATLLLVDWPSLFWFVTGLTLLIYATRADLSRPLTHRTVLAIASGACFFMSLWIKEGLAPLLFALPFLLLLLHRDRFTWRLLGYAGGMLFALLGAELVINQVLRGSPWSRVQAILGGHVAGATAWAERGLVADDLTWQDLALRYIRLYWPTFYGKVLIAASVVSLAIAAITRKRPLLFLGGFALVGFVFVSLAVVSLEPLVPLLRTKDRYISMGLVFLFPLIGGAGWVVLRGETSGSRSNGRANIASLFVGGGLVILLVVTTGLGFQQLFSQSYHIRSGASLLSDTRQVAVALDRDPNIRLGRIVSDWRTLRGILLYLPDELTRVSSPLDYTETQSDFTLRDPDELGPGDLIVLNYTRLFFNEERYYAQPLPDFVRSPPPHWILVRTVDRPRTHIYYVLEEGRVVESGSELLPLFHAYPFREGDAESVERSAEPAQFSITNAEDVRIVLGDGRYHTPPDTSGPAESLRIAQPAMVTVRVHLRTESDVNVHHAAIWIFKRNGSPPTSYGLATSAPEGSLTQLSGTFWADPANGDDSFRLALRVSGSGTLEVKNLSISKTLLDPQLRELLVDRFVRR